MQCEALLKRDSPGSDDEDAGSCMGICTGKYELVISFSSFRNDGIISGGSDLVTGS